MIFYFTATGNSLYIAKQLDTEIISIPQVINQNDLVFESDRIGIVCPIYGHEIVALPDDFDKLLATMRSREISVSIIIQNLAQLKALFEKQWESIVGNCDEFLYLGGNEKETHKYISELLGKETIDLNTYGQSHGRNGNYSTNWQLSGRELMTPDEVRLLDNRLAILFIRGERPIIDEKFDILRHPNVALSADGGTKPYIHGFADCAGVSIIPETDTDESRGKAPEFELPDGIELLELELLSEEEILQEINERNESNNEKPD